MTLSIIIPAYNEEKTIREVLKKVFEAPLTSALKKEIVVIDDCSTDSTDREIMRFREEFPAAPIQYFKHEKNAGKGAALHTGIRHSTGDFVIIQDADLEYDPKEYNLLLEPLVQGIADVVYGSRFMGGNPHRILFFWHSIGNKFLTFVSNALTNLNLTDMETCYKAFRGGLIRAIPLRENRFGFEPEVTAKVAKIPGVRIYEVGISYYGRTYEEGKKINWKDGLRTIYCIFRYNLFD